MEAAETRAQMKTAVDSSVLFDILKGAPGARAAQTALEAALAQGSLCVCAVVVAELERYFSNEQDLKDFLQACQIDHDTLTIDAALGGRTHHAGLRAYQGAARAVSA